MARWMDRQRNSYTYRQTRLGIRQTYNWERTSFSIKETRKSYLLKTGCVRKSLVLLNIVFSILSLGSGPKSSAIFSCKTRTPSRSQKKTDSNLLAHTIINQILISTSIFQNEEFRPPRQRKTRPSNPIPSCPIQSLVTATAIIQTFHLLTKNCLILL